MGIWSIKCQKSGREKHLGTIWAVPVGEVTAGWRLEKNTRNNAKAPCTSANRTRMTKMTHFGKLRVHQYVSSGTSFRRVSQIWQWKVPKLLFRTKRREKQRSRRQGTHACTHTVYLCEHHTVSVGWGTT